MIAVRQKADPKGEIFRQRVSEAIGRSPRVGSVTTGIVRRLPSGELTLVTRGDLDTALQNHATLCREQQAISIPTLTMIKMRGASLVETIRGENLAAQSAFLASMTPDTRGVVFLLKGSRLKLPRVAFAPDMQTLRPIAAALKAGAHGPVKSSRGQVRLHPKGFVEMRLRQPFSNPLKTMIAWTKAHQARWPAVRAIHGARIAVWDKNSEAFTRHHDAAAWAGHTHE